MLFTVLLKVSTALIWIPEWFWTTLSAIIIIAYGSTLIWPELWDRLVARTKLSQANTLATKAKSQSGIWWDILLWASLGPIFASCSPTYALLLSVVFPQSIFEWITYALVYVTGFAFLLLIFAYGGRAIIKKFSRASNPHGAFKKILGIILLITWLLILTWYMKKLQVALLSGGVYNITNIEYKLLEGMPSDSASSMQSASPISWDTSTSPEWAKYLNANYPAPKLAWLENWINGGNYSSLEQLKGKVVIIDFWTYSCINCVRTLDTLKKWDETYRDQWLVIIWVHAPEFQFEKDPKNVQKAVADFGITYPVVQDNSFATRKNFENRYRPAKYLIDKNWQVLYTHFGEGNYEETEKVIQYLLGIWNKPIVSSEGTAGYAVWQTPETYLGTARRTQQYETQATTAMNHRWLGWERTSEDEMITLMSPTGSVHINAYASEVNLVLWLKDPAKPISATIYVDWKEYKKITIWSYQLYNLYKDTNHANHTIELRFDSSGAIAYAYTFW